jgi:hypothetical protein
MKKRENNPCARQGLDFLGREIELLSDAIRTQHHVQMPEF